MGIFRFNCTITNKDIGIDIKSKSNIINFTGDITNNNLNIELNENVLKDYKVVIDFGKVFTGGGGGTDENAVSYLPQDKTLEEKATARTNIDVYSKQETNDKINEEVTLIVDTLEQLLEQI